MATMHAFTPQELAAVISHGLSLLLFGLLSRTAIRNWKLEQCSVAHDLPSMHSIPRNFIFTA